MLTQVVLQTATPRTLKVDEADPADTLILTSISGLTSTDVTLFTGDYSRDGGYYQGRRAGRRNPVFNFKLNPDYANDVDAEDIRDDLFRTFHEPAAGADGLVVTLKSDRGPDRYFVGYTEKIESDQFSKELSAQVSMVCTDPYLRSSALTSYDDAAGTVSMNIAYDGSADSGLAMTLKVKTATPTVVVDIGGITMTLTKPSGNYAVNDIITINTSIGSRSIKLNGTDIMAQLSAASKWLQLTQPVNAFKTYGTAVADGKVGLTHYEYRSAWWGI